MIPDPKYFSWFSTEPYFSSFVTYFLKFTRLNGMISYLACTMIWTAQKIWLEASDKYHLWQRSGTMPFLKQHTGTLLLNGSSSSMKRLLKIVLRTYGESLEYLF